MQNLAKGQCIERSSHFVWCQCSCHNSLWGHVRYPSTCWHRTRSPVTQRKQIEQSKLGMIFQKQGSPNHRKSVLDMVKYWVKNTSVTLKRWLRWLDLWDPKLFKISGTMLRIKLLGAQKFKFESSNLCFNVFCSWGKQKMKDCQKNILPKVRWNMSHHLAATSFFFQMCWMWPKCSVDMFLKVLIASPERHVLNIAA